MAYYRETRSWSPLLGCEAARLSMVGGQLAERSHGNGAGQAEYFAIIPCDVTGKVYRARRSKALDAIEDAINRGDAPGQVAVRGDD